MAFLLCLLFAVHFGKLNAREFQHPGAWDSQAKLDFVKQKIQSKSEPWYTSYEEALSRTATDDIYVERKPHGSHFSVLMSYDEDMEVSVHDAASAYLNTLLWHYTGNEIYANSAIAILDSWSGLQELRNLPRTESCAGNAAQYACKPHQTCIDGGNCMSR